MGSHRGALATTIVATVLAWAAWGFAVTRVDPDAAGALGSAFFGGAFFAAIAGSVTVVGLFARRRAKDVGRAIRIAIRQGLLTALAVVAALFLELSGLLSWWNMIFLIVALTLLELFLISLRGRRDSASA